MTTTIDGPLTAREALDQLEPLWRALHLHHLEVATYRPLLDDAGESWVRRRALYVRLLDDGGALFTARNENGQALGYAFTQTTPGADDTFDAPNGVIELVSLIVLPDARSEGIGTQLLDAVRNFARRESIDMLRVAVMLGNDRARAFYERSGFTAAEAVLYLKT
jgi:ribosomal protein S18 acetylase RimI-like enzyme